MSYNVYSRESCYAPDKDRIFLKSFNSKEEAWLFITTHYNKPILYTRVLMIHPNEHIYDIGSHTEFYSIENTEGDMPL